jgi:hypothetical protein
MPIRSIEKIKIGNYPFGKFANGFIYSAQIEQGYSENTNKLTIDVVYENNAVINLPEKNLTTSYRVEFGDLIIPQVYFISHTKSVGVNEQTVTCTFVDGSVLLDRYYVGLTNRHCRVREGQITQPITVYCADCDNSLSLKTDFVTRSAAFSSQRIGNLLLVGNEEFTDQNCDVPDVKYNFSSLLSAMRRIPNFSFKNFSDIQPGYRNSYSGTLREVLSNWASDFGFSFYWDFITNSLICIDLRNPIDLTPVENLINENFNENNPNANLPISSYSEDESLEGTYQQDNVDYILRPARAKSREIRDVFTLLYSPQETLPFPEIMLALAKYNSDALSLYCLQSNQTQFIGFDTLYFGINRYVLEKALQNIYEYVIEGRGIIRIGKYNKDQESASVSLISSEAEKFGRYYYLTNDVVWNRTYCNNEAKLDYNVTYEPNRSFINGRWIIERNPNYDARNVENFNLDGIAPIYVDINGEVADQVRNAFLEVNPNDTNADRYRGLTLIAYKPYLYINTKNNAFNRAEESFNPAQYESTELPECNIACEKDAATEICRSSCTRLVTPGNGLVSKISTEYTITNGINGAVMAIVLPARQTYIGYAKVEGTFTYTEPGTKEVYAENANYTIDPNVLSYNISTNDLTTDEPTAGSIADSKYVSQSSRDLNITQKNKKKNISLKIIGMNYGNLTNYLNPESGLVSFSVYINDNGVFTDLNFENRPAKRPSPEVIMSTVGIQRMRILK